MNDCAGRFIALLLTVLLIACERDAPRQGVSPTDQPADGSAAGRLMGDVVFTCADLPPFIARFAERSAVLDLTTREVMLPRVMTASGTKFQTEQFTLWTQGLQADLTTPDGSHECRGTQAATPWEAARLRGASFRAIGQEPGWLLEVVPGRWIHVRSDYGRRNVIVPATEPSATSLGRRYDSRSATHTVQVNLQTQPCSDVMSGDQYPVTVVVELDGRKLQGCGKEL